MVQTRILSLVSSALNQLLALDKDSRLRLQRLNQKVIAIELLPFHYHFYCQFTDHDVKLLLESPSHIDTSLRGTPLQFLNVLLTKENRHQFFAKDLTITGDAEVGQQVVALFDELTIDWEEFLSQLIGDAATHHISRFFAAGKNWFNNAYDDFNHNMNDYLHEEINYFPPQVALTDFYQEIDTLSLDVERLAAKVSLLAQKIHAKNNEGNA